MCVLSSNYKEIATLTSLNYANLSDGEIIDNCPFGVNFKGLFASISNGQKLI